MGQRLISIMENGLIGCTSTLKEENASTEMETMFFGLNKLHDRLELLETRLENVLRPKMPCEVAKDGRDKVASQLRFQLESNNKSIVWASERIENILDRLDI